MMLVLLFSFIAACCTHVQANDWNPFKSMEEDHALLENPLINAVIDDDFPFHVGWKNNWQEDKNQYILTIVLDAEDLPSKLRLETEDRLIKITIERKVKIFRVPDDGNLMLMTHKIIEDKIKIVIPKNKLKSII